MDEHMHNKVNLRRKRVGLAVAALILGGAIGSTSSNAVAIVPVLPKAFVGPPTYLALQLRTAGNGAVSGDVVHYTASGGEIERQTFSVNRCAVTTNVAEPSDDRLLKFESSTGTVGLYNNGLGTKAKKTCSPAEGRTAVGESFTVSLGSKFGPSYAIDSSELDIEGKFSATLEWTAVKGSDPDPEVDLTGSEPVVSSSDNGPDAGTGDNEIVKIGSRDTNTDDYRSLVLRSGAGEFALDGGGDGIYPAPNSIGTNDSVFFLNDPTVYAYTVDCEEIVEATSEELGASDKANEDDSRVSQLSFLRLANKNQTDCDPIGVTVSASDTPQLDGAYFDNTSASATNVLQNVRARARIVWIVEMTGKTQAQIDAELSREVQFAVNGASVAVSNCLSVPQGVAANPLNPLSTDVIVHPANTPWCLITDTRLVVGNTIIQTQYYSGNGDPRFF